MFATIHCSHCGTPIKVTPRQREVLNAFAAQPSATNQQIARSLCISVNTLKSHLRELYRTFDVQSRSEFLMACLKEGIIEDE